MDIQRADLKLKKRRKQMMWGGLGLVAMIGLGIWLATLDAAAPQVQRESLWLDSVKRGEMLREVRGPGLLVPKEIRWIAAETPARVERIVVKPGAVVEPDTVILELSNPEVAETQLAAQSALVAAEADLAAQRMTLESQLLDQKANLAGVEADYESARLQTEAEAELAAKGIIPKIQYRRSELASDRLKIRLDIEKERVAKFGQTMQSQLAATHARVDQLRSTADLRARQLDGLKVRARIAGVLQQVPVEAGQQVAAGINLARVARPDVLMAELRIPETQVKDVSIGQSVSVDTRNGLVAGKVIRIDPAVLNGTVLVDVDLEGELPPGARPDLSVDGTIQIERLDDVLYVGRPAYGQPESEVRLFKLDAESGLAQRVPVKLGRASVNLIEIQQGLAPGDQIILSDTSQWDEYDRLRVN
ncbi:MAG: HlyD family efflux transporter periplasmic adaptor subunit [Chiayiivirga sp.]|jgi:HlyD family secretion protein|uniref:efflux RND transporter periplasmic adaptor subunit n=1 Tax=Chiayiivirga sp. TaxID=2041042 RepID=UPI0025C341CF|nr:HlyD family efflux transporter periplasmic adaptor subunit [Chiayiivirga sp.]MCI1709588.1 HlyD family efflux transporter periplasmic adaptor subunit [Chiayiivirga sp.]MCI1730124.1 HlyD family efflux transporter periplasmic adaptor subunit [Chiayiivirga sp.]